MKREINLLFVYIKLHVVKLKVFGKLLRIKRAEKWRIDFSYYTEVPKTGSLELEISCRKKEKNLPSPFSLSEMKLSTLRFPLHISRYNSPGHWRNKSAGGRVGYERSNVCSTNRRIATKPNTSEPFYKVNTMEPAKVYPRLNATSYFHSSNPSRFDPSFELLSTLLVHSSWQYSTVVSYACFPYKGYKLVNS